MLGEPVAQIVPAENSCLHVLPSGTSLTAIIQRGDGARNVFINLIAQFRAQEDCTLNYSFSGGFGEPTPEPTALPAEVDALVAGKTLLELGKMYIDLNAAQCEPPLDLVGGLGDLAFFHPLDLIIVETDSLSIVIGDAYVTFSLAVADPKADPDNAVLQASQAEIWLRALALPVLAPAP